MQNTNQRGKKLIHVGKNQFSFKNEKRTREAILALKIILESRLDTNRRTYETFIDLEKHSTKIESRDKKLILNLYKLQYTDINKNCHKQNAKISKEVRQGCPLLQYSLIFFIEVIKRTKINSKQVNVNGQQIHRILVDSEKDINYMLTIFKYELNNIFLNINVKKLNQWWWINPIQR